MTTKQAEFVNKELNTSSNTILTKKFITPDIPEETELDNAYRKALFTGHENKVEQNNQRKSPAQMKEWSILSDHVKSITSDGSETFNKLSIDQLYYRQDIELCRQLQEKELLNTHVNFGGSPSKLKSEYLDVYEGIHAEIVQTDLMKIQT